MQQEHPRQCGKRPLPIPRRPSENSVWRLTALFALGAFLLVTLLSWSPQLHEVFHDHDQPGPSHECAVSLLSNGQIALLSPEAPISPPASADFNPPPTACVTPTASDLRLAPGRAPPLA